MTIAAKPPKELINSLKPSVGLPLSALLNRVILFGAGAGLLAWGISLTLNRVTAVTATKAFVNGSITTVNSPFSGQIQTRTKLDSGMQVTPKQLLLKVSQPLSDSQLQLVQGLKVDLIAERAKLESIEVQLRKLASSGKVSETKQNQRQNEQAFSEVETEHIREAAFNQLEAETAQTKSDAAIAIAEQNIREAEVALQVAQNHERVAKSKYDKYAFLANQGAMSAFAVDEVRNNWRVSQRQVEEARVKIETAKINLVKEEKLKSQHEKYYTLKNRLPQSKTSASRLTVDSKTETLNPQIADLERQKTELQLSINAKEKALAEVDKSSKSGKNYSVLASDKGVLWEVMVQNGDQVNSGQPLLKQLSCDRLWIDAFVNVDALQRIQIGSPANVELYASNLKLKGWVKTIRSPLSREAKLGQDTAITPPNIESQQLAQVRIELDNPQELKNLKQSSAQFCQVGQVAKVNIDPKDSLLANLPSW